jgi:hypothetical protein
VHHDPVAYEMLEQRDGRVFERDQISLAAERSGERCLENEEVGSTPRAERGRTTSLPDEDAGGGLEELELR